jgi:DNA-binding transcriptional MerR regulator
MYYSIRDVENLTGIKAHTLRIWEQRYQFPTPHRTETNIRLYDANQVKYLLNVSVLLKKGYRVSYISTLSEEQIAQEVLKVAHGPSEGAPFFEAQVAEFLKAMLDLDEQRFEEVFASCLLRLGFEAVMLRVVVPLMERVGALWALGEVNVAQEHFISNLVRRKIIVAIDNIKLKPAAHAATYLLFLPEGEWHELGLLLAKYIIKSRGARTLYLGQSLPYPDLKTIIDQNKPDFVLTFLTTTLYQENVSAYLTRLKTEYPHQKIVLSGRAASTVFPSCSTCTYIPNADALIAFVTNHLVKGESNDG